MFLLGFVLLFFFETKAIYIYIPPPTPTSFVSWSDSEQLCRNRFASLAIIRSEEDNNAALASLPPATDAWIGGSDLTSPGQYKWTDGSSFNYTNWLPGQPDNAYGIEHCVHFYHGSPGHWNDLKCEGSPDFPFYPGALCYLPGSLK